MGIHIVDEQLVQQIERIAQQERRREVDVIAQAVRLYELKAHEPSSSSFLLAIAGLGNSGQGDIAERVEEILAVEIDPVCGWHPDREGV